MYFAYLSSSYLSPSLGSDELDITVYSRFFESRNLDEIMRASSLAKA